MSKNNNSSYGVSLAGLVFVVFLVMKLAKIGEVAEWSWWWVTCPLWITPAIAIIGFLLFVLYQLWADR